MTTLRQTSRYAALRLILVLTLVAQAALSAAAMARMDAGRLASTPGANIVICSPDGIKTVTLPGSNGSGQQAGDCECPCAALCGAGTAQPSPAGAGAWIPVATEAARQAWPVPASSFARLPSDFRPGHPRAPPSAA